MFAEYIIIFGFIFLLILILIAFHIYNLKGNVIFIFSFLFFGLSAFPWYLIKVESGRKISLIILALFYIYVFILSSIVKKIKLNNILSKIKFLIPVIIFYVYSVISLLYTSAPKYGLSKLVLFLVLLPIMLFFAIYISKMDDLKYIRNSIILAAVLGIISLVINIRLHSGINFLRLGFEKTEGTLYLGRLLGAGFICSFSYYIERRSKRSLLSFIFLMLIFIIGIGLSGTRQAFWAIIPSIIFMHFFILKDIKKSNIKFFALILVLLIALILSKNFLSDYFPGIRRVFLFGKELFTGTLESPSFIMRINYLYPNAIKMFRKEILFGGGLGSFSTFVSGIDKRLYPHNIFLEVACEMGIFGLFFFSLIIILIFIKLFKLIRRTSEFDSRVLLSCIGGLWIYFLINSLFTGDLSSNEHFWILSSLVLTF